VNRDIILRFKQCFTELTTVNYIA